MMKRISVILTTFLLCLFSVVNVAFAEDIYKVTFSYNGTSETVEVKAGEKVEPIKTPEKEGYTFYRWKNTTTQATFDFDQPVTSNVVLAAQWKRTKGVDMQELVAGDLDQSDITHVNPNEEFGLTKEKEKVKLLDRFDYIVIAITGFGFAVILAFLIVYSREKKIERLKMEELNKKKENNGPAVCHKCGREHVENLTVCPNCGARLFK